MNALRAYSLVAITLGLLVGKPEVSRAAPATRDLSDECVSPEAKKVINECPGGPSQFEVKKKRHVAFSSAPPPLETNKRTETKPKNPATEMATAFRDTRETRMKQRARALLISEIAGLERLLKSTPSKSPDRLQLMRRLAEGYVELENAAVHDKTEAEIAVQDKKGDPAKLKAEAAKAKKIAEAARTNAIKYYTSLKNEFQDYSKLDEVLYYLAYEHEQAGDLASARSVYYELIEKAPKSPYIPNAYLAFGELFFQEAQGDPSKWDFAIAAYKEVIKYPPPDNKVYGYARYKLGYVFWNQGNYAQAINEFKNVIEFGDKYTDLPNAKQLATSARREPEPGT